jgi:magnesium-transporting ATPase (P-type)
MRGGQAGRSSSTSAARPHSLIAIDCYVHPVYHALRYQAAAAALEGREEKVAAAAEELEDCLTLLGATAIEDRLQAGVQDALRALLAAGMRVWMITGDKRETAINIAVRPWH